tara:strand:- start:7715 stop:8011 length:297 start_codon:yes stop_codon:yes gene_type:complete
MSVNVNPPPQINIPPALAKIPGVSAWFNSLQRMLTQLWLRTGGTTDQVSSSKNTFVSGSISPHILQLRKEIDGLPHFTVDTTGFTADTTFLTADKVIA